MARSTESRDLPVPVAPMMTTTLSFGPDGLRVSILGPKFAGGKFNAVEGGNVCLHMAIDTLMIMMIEIFLKLGNMNLGLQVFYNIYLDMFGDSVWTGLMKCSGEFIYIRVTPVKNNCVRIILI